VVSLLGFTPEEFDHTIKGYMAVMQTALELFSHFNLSESTLQMGFLRKRNRICMVAPIHQDVDLRMVYRLRVVFARASIQPEEVVDLNTAQT
jgi:hypothetical protein